MSKELEAARALVKMLEEKEEYERVRLWDMKPGEVIHGKAHQYIVLKQIQGQTVIISKDLMARDIKFDLDSSNYAISDLKEIIYEDILPIFEADFGEENIVEHEVDLTTIDMQEKFGSCQCKVRPVTFDEAREFNSLLVNDDLANWYWTCTSWSTKERGWKISAAIVSPSGGIHYGHCNLGSGVRPLCILRSDIFVSKGEQIITQLTNRMKVIFEA